MRTPRNRIAMRFAILAVMIAGVFVVIFSR